MNIIAVTGGIASGKSLVLNTFMELGAFVIDCDLLSREAVIPCTKAWREIVAVFGKAICRHNLEIDRKKLGAIVFNDSSKRKILEQIIHPEVRRKCTERIEAIKKMAPNAIVVIDVPLLIETGVQKEFDTVIVVYVSAATQIRRLMERDGITKGEARKMAELQIPLAEKRRFADHIINNEGTREETETQVRMLFEYFSSPRI
ncbi:Dephospho-CoA kinase [ANME-1 cluster archaeon GoMg3.2]|nr:Dephospho-CoA kinase [ANME-1 cluster archaeon GoMg3.2]